MKMDAEVGTLTDDDGTKQPLSESDGSVTGVRDDRRMAGSRDIWQQDKVEVHYGVDETPPLSLCVLLGFQVSFYGDECHIVFVCVLFNRHKQLVYSNYRYFHNNPIFAKSVIS